MRFDASPPSRFRATSRSGPGSRSCQRPCSVALLYSPLSGDFPPRNLTGIFRVAIHCYPQKSPAARATMCVVFPIPVTVDPPSPLSARDCFLPMPCTRLGPRSCCFLTFASIAGTCGLGDRLFANTAHRDRPRRASLLVTATSSFSSRHKGRFLATAPRSGRCSQTGRRDRFCHPQGHSVGADCGCGLEDGCPTADRLFQLYNRSWGRIATTTMRLENHLDSRIGRRRSSRSVVHDRPSRSHGEPSTILNVSILLYLLCQ
mmetsp:Transcript_16640/g.41153  ORF Transcript_16640/g.41153 Transcript_16640/m.41153 type:complete len:260 (-) Transcript_16640:3906-4685(-)